MAELTIVYTDGACLKNPGPGGWAWAQSAERFASGCESHTTNQRMELSAVIQAIESNPGRLRIVSDSTYVVNCFKQRWWAGWRAKNWRNSKGEPVANQDLWRPLIAQMIDQRPGEIEMAWVKGHSGNAMNDLVDRLASDAARGQKGASALVEGHGLGSLPSGS
ncbi:MAG: ribonuclease H family protein [Acidimicrobiales bacterium]